MPENASVFDPCSKFVLVKQHLQKEKEASGTKADKQQDA